MTTAPKTTKRAAWLLTRKNEIDHARTRNGEGSQHNAKNNPNMSGPGWGWWVRAAELVGMHLGQMPYWSGKNPTPSTAIDRGIAEYIRKNAPKELK